MFSVGEKICYPMHGVGVIESIEERTVLGETQPYYVLCFISGRMTAMVPVRTAESVGLRAVIDEAECMKVLAFLQGDACVENDNWNQRYRDNYTKLRGGDIYDVADVIKCLNKREAVKGLSAGERKMLLTARQVMLAELVTATGKPEEEFRYAVGES
ncbi:MAG: CarD family transcriptional regulator [Eubacteriales bacterium]|nr:CarD family transcriptional regulator [Eubacteriales bacterium]